MVKSALRFACCFHAPNMICIMYCLGWIQSNIKLFSVFVTGLSGWCSVCNCALGYCTLPHVQRSSMWCSMSGVPRLAAGTSGKLCAVALPPDLPACPIPYLPTSISPPLPSSLPFVYIWLVLLVAFVSPSLSLCLTLCLHVALASVLPIVFHRLFLWFLFDC